MRQAVGDVLTLAIAAAISPFPIIGVVLTLVSPRGRTNGPMFVVGWLVGLALIGTVGLVVADSLDLSDDGSPSSGASWWHIALGIVLVVLAVRQLVHRSPSGEEPKVPKWMGAVEDLSAPRAGALGVALSTVNPKNLLLTIAATTTIASAGLPARDQAVAYLVYASIASLGVVTPVMVSLALGERSAPMLERLKTWLQHNSSTIAGVIFLVIGARLIGQGIAG